MTKRLNWVVGISVFVGLVTLFANIRGGVFDPVIPAFFIGGQDESEVLFRSSLFDSETFVGSYPFGNSLLRSSELSFLCANKFDEFVAPQPLKTCWSASLNDKNFVFDDVLSFDFFTAHFVPQGRFVGKLNSLVSWNNDWFLKLKPNVISLSKGDSPVVVKEGSNEKFSFVVNSAVDGLQGGFVIKTTKGLFRTESVVSKDVVFSKGNNLLSYAIPSNVFGSVKIVVTPFVMLYDFGLGLTGEDTGYCFFDKKDVRHCVQKRSVSVPVSPLIFDFSVVERNVDLNKDISTKCLSSSDCPTNFGCVQNICEVNGGISGKIDIFRVIIDFLRNILRRLSFV